MGLPWGEMYQGKDCKFKHVKPKCDPSKKRDPSHEKRDKRDKSEDREKKKMIRTPRGGKCFFKHGDKAAPAPKTKARKDSPKHGKEKKGNRFACLAGDLPGPSRMKKLRLPPAKDRPKSSKRQVHFVEKPELHKTPR